eukprot:COSAG01_NODE_49567_length_371_cov_0.680147_1_plen_57_part_10
MYLYSWDHLAVGVEKLTKCANKLLEAPRAADGAAPCCRLGGACLRRALHFGSIDASR